MKAEPDYRREHRPSGHVLAAASHNAVIGTASQPGSCKAPLLYASGPGGLCRERASHQKSVTGAIATAPANLPGACNRGGF